MQQTRHNKWLVPRHQLRRASVRRGIVISAIAAVVVGALIWWILGFSGGQTDQALTPTGSPAPASCVPGAATPAVATLGELANFVDAGAAASGCAFTASVAAPTENAWWVGATPETELVQATRPELVAPLARTSLVAVSRAGQAAPSSWGQLIASQAAAVDMRRGTGVHPALRDAILAELLATGTTPNAALTQVAGLAQHLGPTKAEATPIDELFAAVEAGAVTYAVTTAAAWQAHHEAHPDTSLVANAAASGSAPVDLGLWKQGSAPAGPDAGAFAGVPLPADTSAPGATAADAGAPELVVAPELRLAADAMWTSAMMPMNTLIAMDVSGSMTLPTTAGVSRLELMIQAGQTAAAMFPYHSSSLALWAFSTDRGGPGIDYTSIAASGPADPDPNAAATTQASLVAALNGLPALVGGDTGLYDTVLAAVREVRSTYVPGAVNSVVVLTDGHNDDANSITLEALLSTLKAEADPERPIRVVTIGISSDADANSLQQIADATGGSAHVAVNPADITDILISAMVNVEQQ